MFGLFAEANHQAGFSRGIAFRIFVRTIKCEPGKRRNQLSVQFDTLELFAAETVTT